METERCDKRSAEVKRRYEETKRHRKFRQGWKKFFPWVTLTNGKMFCSICLGSRSFCDKESKFVKDGCANFHIKALQTHGKSEGHKRCADHQKAAAAPPGTNPAERVLQAMNQQHFNKMRTLFRVSHSIAKKVDPLMITRGASISMKRHMAYHSVKPIAIIELVDFLFNTLLKQNA